MKSLAHYLAIFVAAAGQALGGEGVSITRESEPGKSVVVEGDLAIFDLASGDIKVSGKDVRVYAGDYLFSVAEATLQEDGTCRMVTGNPNTNKFRKPRPRKPANQPENSPKPGSNAPALTPRP